ncbi:MAG: ATP-binding protein [Cytophagales bacterium]|nr:ATP-binding protein [Cytophagales bacterium]
MTFLTGLTFSLSSQTPYQYISYAQKEGLSNDFVETVVQDHHGFLWIGTRNGLNRFDGQQFLEFRHDPEDSTSISSNWITKLYEDSRQNLWIGTINGLSKLNKALGRFERIAFKPYIKTAIPVGISNIYEDYKQNIWVSTQNSGLFKLTPDKDETLFHHIYYGHSPQSTNSLKSNQARRFLEDQNHHLWMGHSGGVDRLNPHTDKVDHYLFPTIQNRKPNIRDCTYLTTDAHGTIIAATKFRGMYFIRPSDPAPALRPFKEYFALSSSNLPDFSGLEIDCIQISTPGYLLIGTDHGLFQVDLKNANYTHLTKEILPLVPIRSLLTDRQGNLWLGTSGDGLLKLTTLPDPFRFYQHEPHDTSSISEGHVTTVLEDDSGNIWIGTSGSGLDKLKYDHQGQLIKEQNFKRNFRQSNSLLDDRIIRILKDHQGQLWIGTKGYGLNKLDPISGRFQAFLHDPDNPYSLTDNRVRGLCEDHRGFIWVGSLSEGLNRLDPLSGEVKRFQHDPNNSNSILSNSIRTLFTDSEGYIWIGFSWGLDRLDPEKEEFTHFVYNPNDPGSFNQGIVWCIYEDLEKNLWVGTGNGLCRFDRNSNRFERFYEEDGLPSNTIVGLLEDKSGVLWISTDKGLARQIPATLKNAFHSFTFEDGLETVSFLPEANVASKNNSYLYFGTTDGLVRVNPEGIRHDRYEAKLVLNSVSKLQFDGKDNVPAMDYFISDKKETTFSYKDKIIRFRLSDLNLSRKCKHEYEYQLEGFDQRWIKLGENMDMNFTDLGPGNYTLKARSRNVDTDTSKEVQLLTISIFPPWWNNPWAYFFYLVTLIGLILFFYRFQLKRQLEYRETKRLQALDECKNRMYTNITHEFRTPLTVIQGVTNRISGHDREKQLILRSSSNMLSLVNQILDLCKLKSGKMKLNMVYGNVIGYLHEILESFYTLAENKGVSLHFLSEAADLMMDYDEEKFFRIVSNLLSNAIKFTPRGGNIYVNVRECITSNCMLKAMAHDSNLSVVIQDTGIGIPKEELPHIFNHFYQVDSLTDATQKEFRQASGGAGVGLALCEELVKLLGGTLTVESKPNQGTVFNLRLPISREAQLSSENPDPESVGPDPALIQDERMGENSDRWFPEEASPSLLIIEDNPDVMDFVCGLVENDYKVSTAQNGQEGIEKAIEQIPDIIISDVVMPCVDGFEVCEILKNDERTSHIPIVLLTAKVGIESRISGFKRGADAYLTKPFHEEELIVQLDQLLTLKKRLQQRYKSFESPLPTSEPALQQEDAFIVKVRKTIEGKMGNKDFNTTQLCLALGMSRSQLHLKIKALTNRSTSNYIQAVRLQKARELLSTTNYKIVEIANKVGFQNTPYFSRLFSKEFGVPPSDFRNN